MSARAATKAELERELRHWRWRWQHVEQWIAHHVEHERARLDSFREDGIVHQRIAGEIHGMELIQAVMQGLTDGDAS